MNKSEILDVFYNQISKDYGCSLENIKSNENIVVNKTLEEGRRLFHSDDYLIKVISLNGKSIFSVDNSITNEEIDILKGLSAPWINMYPDSKTLNDIADRYDCHVCHEHHFYLPLGKEIFEKSDIQELSSDLEIKCFEGDSINRFKGDSRFTNALSFKSSAPDMLCLVAFDNGEIVAMAGASADSESMWQIGIDVLPKARGKNIGPILTILLKNKILEMGKVPFYGTAESHIQSQKVAVKSGFMPAWYEAYVYKN